MQCANESAAGGACACAEEWEDLKQEGGYESEAVEVSAVQRVVLLPKADSSLVVSFSMRAPRSGRLTTRMANSTLASS